jgi:hypothetical protein
VFHSVERKPQQNKSTSWSMMTSVSIFVKTNKTQFFFSWQAETEPFCADWKVSQSGDETKDVRFLFKDITDQRWKYPPSQEIIICPFTLENVEGDYETLIHLAKDCSVPLGALKSISIVAKILFILLTLRFWYRENLNARCIYFDPVIIIKSCQQIHFFSSCRIFFRERQF